MTDELIARPNGAFEGPAGERVIRIDGEWRVFDDGRPEQLKDWQIEILRQAGNLTRDALRLLSDGSPPEEAAAYDDLDEGYIWDDLAAARELLSADESLWIRLGTLPGGRSRNHRDGGHEDGVSVYRCELRGGGIYRAMLDDADPMTWLALSASRRAYLVVGKELAERGSDDEPLVSDPRIVALLEEIEEGRGWTDYYAL